MASQFVTKACNNIKITNLLPDLINIILEYLRYQLQVTLSEKDFKSTYDESIDKTLDNKRSLESFESGPIYTEIENKTPDYLIICLQVISRTIHRPPEEPRDISVELEMLIAQPLLHFDEKWIFGSDRCLIDKNTSKINIEHDNKCHKNEYGCVCEFYYKRGEYSEHILNKDKLIDRSNLRYEVRLVKCRYHDIWAYTELPYSSYNHKDPIVGWYCDQHFVYEKPLQDGSNESFPCYK